MQGYELQRQPNARKTSRTHFIWQWRGIGKAIQASRLQPANYRPEQPFSLLTNLQSTPEPTCLSTFFCCFLVSGGSGAVLASSAPASAACVAFALPAWLPPPRCGPLLLVAVGLHSRWLPRSAETPAMHCCLHQACLYNTLMTGKPRPQLTLAQPLSQQSSGGKGSNRADQGHQTSMTSEGDPEA